MRGGGGAGAQAITRFNSAQCRNLSGWNPSGDIFIINLINELKGDNTSWDRTYAAHLNAVSIFDSLVYSFIAYIIRFQCEFPSTTTTFTVPGSNWNLLLPGTSSGK